MRCRTVVRDVETEIMNQNSTETFRGSMLGIANELTTNDMMKLTYYFGDKIPARKRENFINMPYALFEELERRGHIGPENLEFLQESLERIGRNDLASKAGLPKPRLWSKDENYVEREGYRLSVDGGQHLEDDKGHDYVYVPSGHDYRLVIRNFNSHRCRCKIRIDGRVIFPGLIVEAGGEVTLDRPSNTDGKFKFFAISDAPDDSGIDPRKTEKNGCIKVTFTPEVPKMKIICYIDNVESTRIVSPRYSLDTTDVEFHKELSLYFDGASATVMIDGVKPLGKRNIKLVDYGIKNESRVFINFGLDGGGILHVPKNKKSEVDSHEKWVPGATTMQGKSEQTFVDVFDFDPNSKTREVSLHLRLVAKADDKIPDSSNGKCTPFILGNLPAPPII